MHQLSATTTWLSSLAQEWRTMVHLVEKRHVIHNNLYTLAYAGDQEQVGGACIPPSLLRSGMQLAVLEWWPCDAL